MAIDLTFTIRDAYNRRGSKRFEGVATTLATAQTHATGLLADWQAVSDVGFDMQTFNSSEVLAENPVAGANLDAGATIHCRLDNGKLYAFKVPGIKASMLNPDGSVKIDDVAVVALLANYGASGNYRVSEGNYVATVLYGELDR